MLTGPLLGDAIRQAMKLKRLTPTDLAREFHVKPPSVNGWFNTGRISKSNFNKLQKFFSDVVGPEHWGMEENPGHHVTENHRAYESYTHHSAEELRILQAFRLAPPEVRKLWVRQANGVLEDLNNPSLLNGTDQPDPR